MRYPTMIRRFQISTILIIFTMLSSMISAIGTQNPVEDSVSIDHSNKSYTTTARGDAGGGYVWYIANEERVDIGTRVSNGTIIMNSTGSIVVEAGAELVLDNVDMLFNCTNATTPTIQVLDGGRLETSNLRVGLGEVSSPELNYQIIFYPGSTITMRNSHFDLFSYYLGKPAIEVLTPDIEITNCTFANGFTGLSFVNISNISITESKFLGGQYGVALKNSDDVRFVNCTFFNLLNASCKLTDSGNTAPVQMVNCTITLPAHQLPINPPPAFELEHSKLEILNFSYPNISPIENSVALDEYSQLDVKWYLNLKTVKSKDKPVSGVSVVIYNNYTTEVYAGRTDDRGRLPWIELTVITVQGYEQVHYNPFKVTAKKGKDKDELSGTRYVSVSSNNSLSFEVIELTKEKKDEEFDWQSSLLMFCTCTMVIMTVFIIMFTVNIYLARKKAGLDAYRLDGREGTRKVSRGGGATDALGHGELITCSECGTQVTDDAAFCPHCGEMFEGEELECSGCRTKLTEDDTTCPKCGKIFDDDKSGDDKDSKGQKGTKLYCSECGGVVVASDRRCPGCALPFKKTTGAKGGDKEMADSTARKDALPAKKGKTSTEQGKTKKYAYKLTADEEADVDKDDENVMDSDESYMCSVCGAAVSEKAKSCPKCGTELE